MRTNSQLELNLGTFNVPTIAGIIGIFVMVWSGSADRAATDTKTDQRLIAIESAIQQARQARIDRDRIVDLGLSQISANSLKIATLEQAVNAVNLRVDRQADAITGIRDGLATVVTKLEVLTQRIEMSMPLKKMGMRMTQINPEATELPKMRNQP